MPSGSAHDVARAAAAALLEQVKNCLREEEYADAFEVFYEIVSAALEAYRAQLTEVRLRPGRN
jgi:hypothetical protein